MTEAELSYGEEVAISWGLAEVHGTVHEIYGRPLAATSSSCSPQR